MKKIIPFSILIVALLLVKCSSNKNVNPNNKIATQILSFPKSGEDTLKVSYFADTVIYVPLETTPESFMDNIKQLWINDSIIIVNCRNAGLLMFQLDGKFVRKIGKRGRGPGEYQIILNFDVIRDTIYVSSVSRRSFLRYKLDGTFCDEIKLNYQPVYFSTTSDQKLACYEQHEGKVLVYNKNFHTPDTVIVEYGVTKGRYLFATSDPTMTYLQKTPSGLLFYDYMNDTIWNITSDKKDPAYIINLEDKLPRDKQLEFCNGDLNGWANMARSYQFVHLIPFSSCIYVIQRHYRGSTYDATYLKNMKTGEIKRFNTAGIYDNIVSKQNLFVAFYTYSADYLVALGDGPTKTNIKNDPSPLWLKQMKNVKENNNPILALIKLKKNL